MSRISSIGVSSSNMTIRSPAASDAGSKISEASRIGQGDTDRERRGDRRHDSIAGAGNIEDLADFGALNMGRAVGRNQPRPFRAERGENGVETAALDQCAGGSDDF